MTGDALWPVEDIIEASRGSCVGCAPLAPRAPRLPRSLGPGIATSSTAGHGYIHLHGVQLHGDTWRYSTLIYTSWLYITHYTWLYSCTLYYVLVIPGGSPAVPSTWSPGRRTRPSAPAAGGEVNQRPTQHAQPFKQNLSKINHFPELTCLNKFSSIFLGDCWSFSAPAATKGEVCCVKLGFAMQCYIMLLWLPNSPGLLISELIGRMVVSGWFLSAR